MTQYEKLISEISNPIRIQLLFLLQDQNRNLSSLTKEIGKITPSEVSRHLGRLAEQGFVRKESATSRNFELTSLGRTIISLFSPIDFIFKNSKYFRSHSLGDIPYSFICELDSLRDCEIVFGTGNVMMKISELVESVNEEFRVMSVNPFPFSLKGKKVQFILPKSNIIREFRETHGVQMRKEILKIETRFLPSVTISMGISDTNKGLLTLPAENESSPDFNSSFYIQSEQGIAFLRSLWNHYWNKGSLEF